MRKIVDGFKYTIGVVLAMTVVNMFNAALDNAVKKADKKCECKGDCNCGKTEE